MKRRSPLRRLGGGLHSRVAAGLLDFAFSPAWKAMAGADNIVHLDRVPSLGVSRLPRQVIDDHVSRLLESRWQYQVLKYQQSLELQQWLALFKYQQWMSLLKCLASRLSGNSRGLIVGVIRTLDLQAVRLSQQVAENRRVTESLRFQIAVSLAQQVQRHFMDDAAATAPLFVSDAEAHNLVEAAFSNAQALLCGGTEEKEAEAASRALAETALSTAQEVLLCANSDEAFTVSVPEAESCESSEPGDVISLRRLPTSLSIAIPPVGAAPSRSDERRRCLMKWLNTWQ